MKRCVSITCDFDLAIGKVNLNEIVYRLKEVRDSPMLRILKQILMPYDDLIMDRLTRTKIYPSEMRKRLGRYVRKEMSTVCISDHSLPQHFPMHFGCKGLQGHFFKEYMTALKAGQTGYLKNRCD